MLKKVSPSLYQALGIFLPLITTNCAVLGVAILMISKEFNLLQSIVYSVATAIGFALALVLFAGIRERLELEDVPKAVQGVPVALITAGILAMASWVSPGWYNGYWYEKGFMKELLFLFKGFAPFDYQAILSEGDFYRSCQIRPSKLK